MARILLLNGPNLNLLGKRERDIYGTTGLAAIEARCREVADGLDCRLDCFASNAEHALIERIHEAGEDGTDWIVVNPAALTHTSVALRDALLGVGLPFIEIHLSNIQAREDFRHRSLISDVARGVISGLGPLGYELAIRAAAALSEKQ